MPDLSTHGDTDKRPVIYAGRFVDKIADLDLPDNCIVLGEQDMLPQELAAVLNRANVLVFLDPLSFPLEAIADDHWDVPVVVVLPSGFDAESLMTALGPTLFERLGFFDHVVISDSALWEKLRRKYHWAESQRIPVASHRPGEVTVGICTPSEVGISSPTTPGRNRNEAAWYWHGRNHELAISVSHRTAHGVNRAPHFNKALHRVQARALEPWFAAPRWRRNTEVPLDVLEMGTGVGRWASSFDLTKTRFTGLDAREDLLETARANFPEGRFVRLNADLLFPYGDESFDLAFSVTFMHLNSAPAKQTLLSEMWRVTRPGGRLLFLENFVFEKRLGNSDVYPTSVTEFVDLIVDAMAGQVALEHVESLRYPGEDLRGAGVLSLLRLGVSRTR